MAAAILDNPELKLARNFIQNTGCHLFLTGKAGTGKTTFLHSLKQETTKQMIVTAPTGVAAINAGGVTLHSFFQLPFGPFIPGSESDDKARQRQFRFSREKKLIITRLDLLVIDEISMVRADLLDAVDAVLRRLRRNDKPFGGVQLLMIGDLHQLPPVAKQDEWQLLQQYYASVYFFSSQALQQTQFLTLELNHIYRQSDPGFIQLLNQVRDNQLDKAAIARLNQQYIQDHYPDEDQGYITLTTHNASADSINQKRLCALAEKEYCFIAEISGDFPEHAFPTPGSLALRKGAQVMFLRNDPSSEKRYYNGKIGKINRVSTDTIWVSCPGETEQIPVKPVDWENIKYTMDPETKEIQEQVIGRFKQFPLKLAWAITIHKSQGLTFEKAVIDAGAAFTHGQVYVALSRCKTFEGIVLSSPVPSKGIEIDTAILGFVEHARQNPPSERLLEAARIDFQQELLLECFDFQLLQSRFSYLVRLVLGNAGRIQVSGVADLDRIREMADADIFRVGEKFKQQLQGLFDPEKQPESDPFIHERLTKASVWFQDKFFLAFDDITKKMRVETDNKDLGKRIDTALNTVRQELAVKLAAIHSCEQGFSSTRYLRAVSTAQVDFLPTKIKKQETADYTESDIAHPQLFQTLKEWRSQKAKQEGVAHFQILHQRVLIQIVVCLPDTKTDLKQIKGVGKKTIERYSDELLGMVKHYRRQQGIETVILPEPKAVEKSASAPEDKPASPDTRQISLDLFNKGLSPAKISEERGLVENTILGHLSFFVEKGDLDINRLLSSEKQSTIKEKLAQAKRVPTAYGSSALKAVKKELGNDVSYGDIKLVLAHLAHRANRAKQS